MYLSLIHIYLALRSEKAFDKGNEIGQLNTGDLVEVTNRKDATYWYAYVPRLDKSGYLDKNYIQIAETVSYTHLSYHFGLFRSGDRLVLF